MKNKLNLIFTCLVFLVTTLPGSIVAEARTPSPLDKIQQQLSGIETRKQDARRGGCYDETLNITPPSIVGVAIKSDNRIKGTIIGPCLTEAGIYEGNALVQTIDVVTDMRKDKTDFSLFVREGEDREIRAKNVRGAETKYNLPDSNMNSDPLGIGVNTQGWDFK